MSAQPVYPSEKVVDYDPRWPDLYERCATTYRSALGSDWQLEHVGSTSVPGLAAKPVIDLALGLPAGEELNGWAKVSRPGLDRATRARRPRGDV